MKLIMFKFVGPLLALGAFLISATEFNPVLAQSAALNSGTLPPVADNIKKEKRLALVVGNNSYPNARLVASINDARAMAETLRKLNFDVVLLEDANQSSMNNAIGTFTKILSQSDAIGLFYFAGHGVQSDSKNFLIPVDAKITKATDIERQGIDIQSLLDKFSEKQNGMNILILDACRDNPFSDGGVKRSSGLAAVDGPPGTIVAFATAPGKVAQETGDHGAYTRSVLKHISEPGLPIEEIFKRVRSDVLRATNNAQVPWENTSLVRDFYFQAAKAGQGYLLTVATEELEWNRIENSKNLYDFVNFLQRFPNTKFDTDLLIKVNLVLSRMNPRPPTLVARDLPNLWRTTSTGVGVRTLNKYAGEYFKSPAVKSFQITNVQEGSMAANAGLLVGDIVLSINGKEITNFLDDRKWIGEIPAGEYVNVIVWRNHQKISLSGIAERASLNRILSDIALSYIADKNIERARLFVEYLANAGDMGGQRLLGLAYVRGLLGESKNYPIAAQWLAKAVKQGDSISAAFLAAIYIDPNTGISNNEEAFRLATFAASQGSPEGAAILAQAYATGVGTTKDIFLAIQWTKLAAYQGIPYGMYLLGVASINGEGGVPKDIDEAKRWLRQASELKFAPATARLKLLEGQ